MAGAPLEVFKHDWITVWCEPQLKLVSHQIHQYTFGQVFRDALSAGVQAMRQHGCTRWLSDDRKNGPLPPEELVWAEKTWAPLALAAGWSTWALVVPSELLGQLNLQRHAKLYRDLGVWVETFALPEDARRWLASM